MKTSSPNMVILVIVLILACSSVAIYLNRKTIPNSDPVSIPSQTPKPSISPSIQPTASVSTIPSKPPQEKPSPISSILQSPVPLLTSLSSYIYPQAKVISQLENKLELESNAAETEITNWYKNKIKENGFNAKSFTQTNTNGVVFNKLSAAKPGEKIEITIKKDQNASKVTITVDRP